MLHQPYPFFHKGRELLRNTLLIVSIGFLFDYLIEPFNVNRAEHRYAYWVICLAHTGGAAVAYFVYSSIVGLFIHEDDWNVKKGMLYSMGLLLMIGILNFFWRDVIYDNPHNFSLRYFIEEIKNTFLVGSLILFFIMTINFNLQSRKNKLQASHFHQPNAPEEASVLIPIQAAIPSDNFKLDPAQLLCIRSDGNYVEFYLREGNETKKLIKRLTLQSAADQLADFPFIQKTHRAFLVNTRHVGKVEGNAQGYQLTIDHLQFSIPVSRGHIAPFNAALGQA